MRHLKCLDSFWEVVFGEGRGYEKSLPSHVKEKLSPKITKASQTQWNSNSMAFIPSLQTFKYCRTSNSWAHPRTAIPTFTQKSEEQHSHSLHFVSKFTACQQIFSGVQTKKSPPIPKSDEIILPFFFRHSLRMCKGIGWKLHLFLCSHQAASTTGATPIRSCHGVGWVFRPEVGKCLYVSPDDWLGNFGSEVTFNKNYFSNLM